MTNTSAQEIRRLLESIQIDETHPAHDHTHPQHELAAKAVDELKEELQRLIDEK